MPSRSQSLRDQEGLSSQNAVDGDLGASAGSNQTSRQSIEKADNLCSMKLAPYDNVAIAIDAVKLKNALGRPTRVTSFMDGSPDCDL